MSPPTAQIADELAVAITPILSPRRFSRKNRTWNREIGGSWVQAIEIDAGMRHSEVEGHLALSLGLVNRTVTNMVFSAKRPLKSGDSCRLKHAIIKKALSREGGLEEIPELETPSDILEPEWNGWWQVTEEASEGIKAISDALLRDGLPWLERIDTPAAAMEMAGKLMPNQGLILAVLHWDVGEKDRAREMLAEDWQSEIKALLPRAEMVRRGGGSFVFQSEHPHIARAWGIELPSVPW